MVSHEWSAQNHELSRGFTNTGKKKTPELAHANNDSAHLKSLSEIPVTKSLEYIQRLSLVQVTKYRLINCNIINYLYDDLKCTPC